MVDVKFNRELDNNYDDSHYKKLGIFLAGPTRRNSPYCNSWRFEAVCLFEKYNFDGTIYVPEERYDTVPFDDSPKGLKIQHRWEWDNLNRADVIMFWIPRDQEDGMPAYTTNVEFGFWMAKDPKKIVLGYPTYAEKMGYLIDLYQNFGGEYHIQHTLEDTVKETLDACLEMIQ